MPRRNVIKTDIADGYYHVYFRGIQNAKLFRESADFEHMLSLYSRYLALKEVKNAAGISFPNYSNRVELLAFCLMPTHVHMFVYQRQVGDMSAFMRSLLTSYSMYFNKKYKRTGPLFESRYKAALVEDAGYYIHISRYIHLVPKNWNHYEYSSLPYYLHHVSDEWINPFRVIDNDNRDASYLNFMSEYSEAKMMNEILAAELAG